MGIEKGLIRYLFIWLCCFIQSICMYILLYRLKQYALVMIVGTYNLPHLEFIIEL